MIIKIFGREGSVTGIRVITVELSACRKPLSPYRLIS
jgi:hypothetical protein